MAVLDELSVFCRNFFGLILTDLPLSSESYLSFLKSSYTRHELQSECKSTHDVDQLVF